MSLTIGPYVIEKGALLPYDEYTDTDQTSDKDGDGGIVVHRVPYREKFIRAVCKCSVDEARALEGFLTDGMQYKAITFVLVDGLGSERLVRFWDDRVRRKHLGGNRVELDLLFREEAV